MPQVRAIAERDSFAGHLKQGLCGEEILAEQVLFALDREMEVDLARVMIEFLHESKPPAWKGHTAQQVPAALQPVVLAIARLAELR